MRRIYFIITLALISMPAIGQVRLKFINENVNVGKIQQDSLPVSFYFSYKNLSNQAVAISSIQPSSNNVKSLSKISSVAAGKDGAIAFQYINAKTTGKFKEQIIVQTDDPAQKEKTLFVYGEIVPRPQKGLNDYSYDIGGLSIAKKQVYLGEYSSSGTKTESFIVYNNSQKTMTIQNSPDNKPYISCKVTPSTIAPKKTAIVNVAYNCKAKRDFGLVKDTLLLLTDDEAMPTKLVHVAIEIQEDFSKITRETLPLAPKISISDNVFNFGKVKQGTMVECEFVIRNTGKKELVIRKIWSENENINADIFPRIRNNKDFPLKIAFMTDQLSGSVMEKIYLVSNDPQKPKLSLYIEGTIIP